MHPLATRVLAWLDIETDEVKPVGLCFAVSFTWGFSQMLSWTTSSTLFLKYYSAAELPYVGIASAFLIPASGLLFIRLNQRLRYSTQFLTFAALFVAAPVLFRMFMFDEQSRWPSMGFAIWYYLEVAFAGLLMDSLVTRLFNLRQVKRVFGPIQTGSDMAGVPAGLLIALIVSRSGVENLLYFSAAINAIVIVLFVYIDRAYRSRMQIAIETEEDEAGEEGPPGTPLMALFRMPLVLCILGIVALSEFNLEFINVAFYSRTEIFMPDPEKMAAFLGTFFAVASVFSSVIQMLASSRLMKWIGIGGCLIVGPIMVGASLLLFLVSDYMALAAAFVFGCMATAKFVQFTVWVNVSDVAQFTLVRSLPTAIQDRVLALSGTVLAPVLGGFSGLVLLGMMQIFGATAAALSLVIITILVVIVFIGLRAAREYRRNLHELLANRAITGIELPLDDSETSQTLLALAADPDPQTALCSLELLSKRMNPQLKPALEQALRHPVAAVRRQAAVVYLRLGQREDLPVIMAALEREKDPEVVAELLPVIGKFSEEAGPPILLEYLKRTDQTVVQGACVALIRHCSGSGQQEAGALLSERSQSRDPGERRFAAQTLGRIRASEYDALLVPLLQDPDPGVRTAAIGAAGRLRHPAGMRSSCCR